MMNFKRLIVLSFICTICYAEESSKQNESNTCFSGKTAITAKKLWFFSARNNPDQEKCKVIDIVKLKDYKCEYVSNTYGGKTAGYSFTDKKHNYIAYSTLSDCKDGLDTERANGP